jgi:hypothetical protein
MTRVSEDATGVTRARELDKGATARFAREATCGNEDVGHVPIELEVAAKVCVASAWCHVIYVQPPVYMQPAHRRRHAGVWYFGWTL